MYGYHAEYKHNGKQIIIDAAQIGGRYEIMTMYADGTEIETAYADTLDEAGRIFHEMRNRHPETLPPLTGKYAKLRDDLIKAMAAGRDADHGEDGGTCNFDAPSIRLPRWNSAKVEQAAKEAGTSCFKWDLYGNPRFVFSTRSSGHANRNCRVSATMCKSLAAAGYDILEYCAMD